MIYKSPDSYQATLYIEIYQPLKQINFRSLNKTIITFSMCQIVSDFMKINYILIILDVFCPKVFLAFIKLWKYNFYFFKQGRVSLRFN